MRAFINGSILTVIALLVIGPNAFTRDARAESSAAAVSSADRASILRSLKMVADSRGQVENECSEKVTPQFLSADLGGVVGIAVLKMKGAESLGFFVPIDDATRALGIK